MISKKFIKNNYLRKYISYSLGTWFNAIISFFTTPVITYLINPEEFGKASVFFASVSLLQTLVSLATHQAFVRFYYSETSEESRNELFWSCLLPPLFIITFLIVPLFYFRRVLSSLLSYNNPEIIVFLIFLSLLFGTFQTYNVYSLATKRMGIIYSLVQIISNISNMISIILLVKIIGTNFVAIVISQIISSISGTLLGILFERNQWKPVLVRFSTIKKILVYSVPFLPSFLISWIYQSFDRLMLRQFASFESVGYYSVAFKLASVVNLVQAGFSTLWFSIVYEKYETNPEQKDFYVKANLIVSGILFLFGSIIILCKDFIFLILSENYRKAAQISPFLVLGPIFFAISETTAMGINFTKKTYWHILISTGTATVNIVGNAILIPGFGAKGAAVSTGISYFVLFLLRTYVSQKLYYIPFRIDKILVASAFIIFQAFLGTFFSDFIFGKMLEIFILMLILLSYRDVLKTVLTHSNTS